MIIAAFIMVASLSTSAMAQNAKKAPEAAAKEHKCSAACTKDKHQYAHGEKGHKCTDACKKDVKKG